MNVKTANIFLAFLLTAFLISACKQEKLEPVCNGSTPTWDDGISAIVQSTCMGSTCHKAGASRGDFTTFAGIEPFLNNGSFVSEVLVDQSMPRFDDLTQEEINQFQCWFENGFPEN